MAEEEQEIPPVDVTDITPSINDIPPEQNGGSGGRGFTIGTPFSSGVGLALSLPTTDSSASLLAPDDNSGGMSTVSSTSSIYPGRVPLDETFQPKILKTLTNPGVIGKISARDFIRRLSVEGSAATSPPKGKAFAQLMEGGPRPILHTEHQLTESRIMVLYTGGTIGMCTVDGVYQPMPNYLPSAIGKLPPLHDKEYIRTHYPNPELQPYCLPVVKNTKKRVVYWVLEYEPLLDSSDMTFDDWIRIGRDIQKAYDKYDGFVILHGTDTLAYTASALSFMLENLGKPVVVTGAQIPVVEVRSDGRENLIGALIVAGNYDIPEVTVYFNSKLFRGNRTSKVDNSALDAFNSPNMNPLAEMEINIKVNNDSIYRCPIPEKMHLQMNLNRNVGLLRIMPSMPVENVKGAIQGLQGLVLHTYGAGNMPSKRLDIIEVLREAIERGVIVVNCSQCIRGKVDVHYFTGKVLYDIGVISGSDMTVEAAITKLSYVLGKETWDHERRIKMMQRNLRGELTTPIKQEGTLHDLQILPRLAKFLRLNTTAEVEVLRNALFPPLILSAAAAGDLRLLQQLRDSGAVLNAVDYEQRNGLHVAAASGQIEAVSYLVTHGVSIHAKDLGGDTPLLNAIQNGHVEMVQVLRKAGASIPLSSVVLGVELCMVASVNDVAKMFAWMEGGADLNAADYDGRTPLHIAASHGHMEMVTFLVENGAVPTKKDGFGNSPLDEAKKRKAIDLTLYLESYVALPAKKHLQFD